MSSSEVTRAGVRGERPGREAPPMRAGGAVEDGRRGGGRGGGRGRGEQIMAGRAEFTSYYGRPVIKAPSWSARDIAGYFFLGGLAGAGSVLAAGAQLTGRRATARALKTASALAVTGSVAALVHDLGRPQRFVNMLRVFKPTSPMSMGSWLLAGYGPAAGAAAVLDRAGRVPKAGAAATAVAGALGPMVTTYTAVLAADTAVPAWHGAYRELPVLFAGSALTAASGMALLTAPPREAGPARRAALLGCAAEIAATRAMRGGLGVVAETYERAAAGRLMRAAEVLSVAGAVAGAYSGRVADAARRPVAAAAGLALLAASACTRFGVFHAGIASADDPKYTVLPQRERLDRRGGTTGTGADAARAGADGAAAAGGG